MTKMAKQIHVDNFSTHRKYAKGFISSRVDDPNKMRDYETLRGYFSKNNLAYISSKIRHLAIKISYTYGNEREILKTLFKQKLGKIHTLPGGLMLGIYILLLGLAVRFLRMLSLNLPWDRRVPRKSIIFDRNGYISFDSKEYFNINFKDIWRPSIICLSGEAIKSRIKKSDNSELRISFALLENADPKIFSGDYNVNIKYSLKSINNESGGDFSVPINAESEDMEHSKHSLWMDFKIDLSEFPDGDIEFTLKAEYQQAATNKPIKIPSKTPSIAWGAPHVAKNKVATQTKKIFVLSLETLTDPFFISENYNISTDHLFTFLNSGEWKIFKRSYSQSDGTLGAAGSLFTGLTPFQHGLFDYSLPYYTNYSKAWNPGIVTLAQLLKKMGFSTHSIGLKAFSGYAGCSRGFDSHIPCYGLHGLDCADFEWFYQTWNNIMRNDAFIFMHFDRLHKPYGKCTRRINRIYSTQEITNKWTPLEKYVNQMRQLDMEIKRIISFLKGINQYENTMIICTGDHGGAYAWEKRQAYDLYEDRTRVPLWIKGARWTDLGNMDTGKCVNSTIFPYLNILKWMNILLPEYFKNLAQVSPEFDGVAISETATHPTERDYVLSLTDRDHKYVRFMKVDWIQNVIIEKGKEFLQPYAYASTDYGLDKDCSHEEPDKFQKMKKLADTHIESSFEFRRLYGGLR